MRLELANQEIFEMLVVLLPRLQYSLGKIHSVGVLFKTEKELDAILAPGW